MTQNIAIRCLIALLILALPAAAQAQIIANDDAYSVDQGGTLIESPPGVLGNDFDPERDSLDTILVSGPSNAASFSLGIDGGITYVHDGSATTSDAFTYQATDGAGISNVATVTITINPILGGPEAGNDSYTLNSGDTLNINAPGVLANDSPAGEGGTLTAILVAPPASHVGAFTLNADGSFQYVHDGGGETNDSFTYQASEGGVLSGIATVTFTIEDPNGGGDGATLSVRFADLSTVEHSSLVGGGNNNAQAQLGFLAGAVGATVSGNVPGLPADTFELVILAGSRQLVDDVQGIFNTCEKYALVAQGRPDKYDFTVTLGLDDPSQIATSGQEEIAISLDEANISCRLTRVQNTL